MPLEALFGANDDRAADALFSRFAIDTGKKYGEGGYGATYPGMDKETKERLAVKVIDTRRMSRRKIEQECAFVNALDHPNVIKIKAHGLGQRSLQRDHLYFIFMELADGGELFDQVITRGSAAMSEEVAKGFMRQLVVGVLHCHERGIAHRDLKLENVMLTGGGYPDGGIVKIIDFGLAHQYKLDSKADGRYDRSKPLTECCGSRSYAAPQVLNSSGYDGFAADMWSLGVCLFAMLSGFFPLDEASSTDWRYAKLVAAQQAGRSTTKEVYAWYKRGTSHLSKEVIGLLDGLLTVDPAKRLGMQQVLKHPWIAECPGPIEPMSDEQGTFNQRDFVDMSEEVVWRGLSVTGVPVRADDDIEFMADDLDSGPVYRGLGGFDALDALPEMPSLSRQRAFSRYGGGPASA